MTLDFKLESFNSKHSAALPRNYPLKPLSTSLFCCSTNQYPLLVFWLVLPPNLLTSNEVTRWTLTVTWDWELPPIVVPDCWFGSVYTFPSTGSKIASPGSSPVITLRHRKIYTDVYKGVKWLIWCHNLSPTFGWEGFGVRSHFERNSIALRRTVWDSLFRTVWDSIFRTAGISFRQQG